MTTTIDELGGWPALLTELLDRRDLPASHARAAMATILRGDATPAQLIGFIVALKAKGETPEEISGLLDAVLDAATIVPLPDELRDRAIDIVGTGGDRSHSINVSVVNSASDVFFPSAKSATTSPSCDTYTCIP